jgi:hypothetical protein
VAPLLNAARFVDKDHHSGEPLYSFLRESIRVGVLVLLSGVHARRHHIRESRTCIILLDSITGHTGNVLFMILRRNSYIDNVPETTAL